MSETGRKTTYSVGLHIQEKGVRPPDAEHRIERLVAWSQPKIVNDLFPVLRELGNGTDESTEQKCYPMLVPLTVGLWEPCAIVTVLVAHICPMEEVADGLKDFLREFGRITVAALDPLPPAENWSFFGDNPKKSVGFLSRVHWQVPRLH